MDKNKNDKDPHSLQNVWKSIDKMVTFGGMPWKKIAEFLNITKTPTFSDRELWSENMVRILYKIRKNSDF